jgi:multiple sugar transport system ATP-binding protein
MAAVTITGVNKYFGSTHVIRGVDIAIDDGEFCVLVGPSGCGKSTLLRMIAGLEEITQGEVSIGGRVVNRVPPKERDIAMVFQNYALYPHLSVADNIAFGLRLRKTPKETMEERVQWAAKLLGLTQYLDRRPKELSGGQRQRVAMGRAIVRQPQVFLMDEPLSNLDAKLRVQMRAEIGQLQRELATTTIYVTHDQTEAMTMGDHVAVMRKGELQQMDQPQKLYSDPKNLFVASFIGSPSMNLVEAQIDRSNGNLVASLGDQQLNVPTEVTSKHPALEGYVGRRVALGIRPEQLEDAAIMRDAAEGDRLRGRALLTEALGAEVLVHVELPGKPVVTDDVVEGTAEVDDALVDDLTQKAEGEHTTFVGRFHAASEVRPTHIVEMVVDTNNLQFFDLETGNAIRTGE